MADTSKLLTVALSQTDADILKIILETNGIKSAFKKSDPGTDGEFAGNIEIYVSSADYAKAAEMIDGQEDL